MNAIVSGNGMGLPTGQAGEGGVVVVDVQADGTVEVPAGHWVLGAEFVRQGPDLLLIGQGGERVLLKGYFAQADAPDLVLIDGARLNGDLVLKLAGPMAPAEFAQAGRAGSAEAIGKVETVEGTVTVRHADGTEAALHKGDPVFQGDVLETGPTGAIGVVFADQSTFSLAQSARMTLDEMVYDPGAQVGSFKASLVQGVFSFISGEIAKTGPEAMTITTPVATIGIRGTTGAINLPQGQGLTVVLTADKGGTVGELTVFNAAGVQVLSAPFQATNVTSLTAAPSTTFTMTLQQFNSTFAQAVAALPPSPSQGGGQSGNSGGQSGAGAGTGNGNAEGGPNGQGGEGTGEPGAGTGEPGTGLQPAGEGPLGPVVGPVMADLGALAGLTGLSQQTIAEVVNDVINNLVNNLLAGPMGDNLGGLFGSQFGTGQFGLGDFIGGVVGGAIGDGNGDDGDDDDGYVFYDLFDRKVVATTGDDNLVDDDTSTQFVMAQGGEGAPIASNSLGGDDTVDGGGGTDQITFDNLWQVSGRLDGELSKITLWNWTDSTPLNPEDGESASVEDTDATVAISGIDLFLFRSYEYYGYPENAGALQVPNFAMGGEAVGEIVVGGEGNDTINGDETWFQDANAVVVLGGGGDDVIYGASGEDSWNSLSGGAGNDDLYALYGDTNMLDGGDGDDTLTCGAEVGATLDGGAGDDTFKLTNDQGWYNVVGGEDIGDGDTDTVDYSEMGSPVTFNMEPALTASRGSQQEGTLAADALWGIERLQGSHNGDVYSLSGTVDPDLFAVNAGEGDDTVYASTGTTFNGEFDAGEGTDTLTVSGSGISLEVISNFEEIYGSSGDDGLTVNCSLDGVAINLGEGTDSLTLSLPDGDEATLILSGVESLTLADVDPGSSSSVYLNNAASGMTIDMGDGYDELYLASVAVDELNYESNQVTVRNVEDVSGGQGDDTVTFAANLTAEEGVEVNLDSGDGDNDTVILAAGANTINISNVETVVGSSNNDTLTFSESVSNATIDLGDGTDSVILAMGSGNDMTLANVETVYGTDEGNEQLSLNGLVNGLSVDLGDGSDGLWLAEGSNALTISNVETVNGSAGNDTLTLLSSVNDVAIDLAGTSEGVNVLNLAAGSNTLSISNVNLVNGSSGNDTLSFSDTVSNVSIDLAGGSGDILNLAAGINSLSISNVETVNGSTSNDTLSLGSTVSGVTIDLGGGTGDVLNLAEGSNALTISNVETVNGSANDDTLSLGSTLSGAAINLGGGTGDILNLAAGSNTLSISNVETVNGSSGNDTLSLGSTVSNVTIDLGGGTGDTLNLAEGSNTLSISNVETVNGTAGDDTLTFESSVNGTTVDLGGISIGPNVLNLADGGNTVTVANTQQIYGGSGADNITISSGDVTVVGGGGDDHIVDAGGGHLTVRYTAASDFGTNGDVISGFVGGGTSCDVFQFLHTGVDLAGSGFLAWDGSAMPALDSSYGIINLTTNVAGDYSVASDVATAFSALGTSDTGTQRILVAGDGTNSMLWHWDDGAGNSNGQVDAAELQAVATVNNVSQADLVTANFSVDDDGYGPS